MPIHEYRCRNCGDQFEIIQRVSDRPLQTCQSCGGPLEKLLSRSTFALKGGGWYADGYSARHGAPSAGSDAKSKPSGGTPPAKDSGGAAGKSGASD